MKVKLDCDLRLVVLEALVHRPVVAADVAAIIVGQVDYDRSVANLQFLYSLELVPEFCRVINCKYATITGGLIIPYERCDLVFLLRLIECYDKLLCGVNGPIKIALVCLKLVVCGVQHQIIVTEA